MPAAKIEAGKAVFAANCVACHGDDAKGKADLGAPDLTDQFWIYGGDAESIYDDGLGRPARPHAELGRTALAARPQDLALYLFDLCRERTDERDRRSDEARSGQRPCLWSRSAPGCCCC